MVVYYPAVLVSASLGGLRAGALAIVLSALVADYFFLPPIHSLAMTGQTLTVLALFIVVAAIIVGMVSLLDEAMDRLWAQVENTRFVVDMEPAGIIAVDNEGVISLVNAGVERQLGYRRDELIGRSVEALVPADLRFAHRMTRTEFFTHPEPRRMGGGRDLHALHRDGSLVPVEVGLNPFERNGRTGAIATIIDISERKALERRAELLAQELRHRSGNLLAIVQALAIKMLPSEH
jgi:PAS domain S-box-containing protein